MSHPPNELRQTLFEAQAASAAQLLKVLANEHRLLVLRHLQAAGETSVSALVRKIGLSQSALSQHLGRLRAERLVAFRREAQTLFYRVSDARAERLLAALRDIYCPTLGTEDAPK